MGKMCLGCFESYSSDIENLEIFEDDCGIYYTCPKRGCGSPVVEIDELFLPAIIILNQKGYYTDFCCAGHLEEILTTPYITFNEVVESLPNIPKGFTLTLSKKEDGINTITISCNIFKESPLLIWQSLLNNALQIYVWASNLPNIELDIFDILNELSGEERATSKTQLDPEKLKKDIENGAICMADFKKLRKENIDKKKTEGKTKVEEEKPKKRSYKKKSEIAQEKPKEE